MRIEQKRKTINSTDRDASVTMEAIKMVFAELRLLAGNLSSPEFDKTNIYLGIYQNLSILIWKIYLYNEQSKNGSNSKTFKNLLLWNLDMKESQFEFLIMLVKSQGLIKPLNISSIPVLNEHNISTINFILKNLFPNVKVYNYKEILDSNSNHNNSNELAQVVDDEIISNIGFIENFQIELLADKAKYIIDETYSDLENKQNIVLPEKDKITKEILAELVLTRDEKMKTMQTIADTFADGLLEILTNQQITLIVDDIRKKAFGPTVNKLLLEMSKSPDIQTWLSLIWLNKLDNESTPDKLIQNPARYYHATSEIETGQFKSDLQSTSVLSDKKKLNLIKYIRSTIKKMVRYNKKLREIVDLVRTTVLVDNLFLVDQIEDKNPSEKRVSLGKYLGQKLHKLLAENLNLSVYEIDFKFLDKPWESGYSDITIKFIDAKGFVYEVQFNSKDTLAAKENETPIFNECKDIEINVLSYLSENCVQFSDDETFKKFINQYNLNLSRRKFVVELLSGKINRSLIEQLLIEPEQQNYIISLINKYLKNKENSKEHYKKASPLLFSLEEAFQIATSMDLSLVEIANIRNIELVQRLLKVYSKPVQFSEVALLLGKHRFDDSFVKELPRNSVLKEMLTLNQSLDNINNL